MLGFIALKTDIYLVMLCILLCPSPSILFLEKYIIFPCSVIVYFYWWCVACHLICFGFHVFYVSSQNTFPADFWTNYLLTEVDGGCAQTVHNCNYSTSICFTKKLEIFQLYKDLWGSFLMAIREWRPYSNWLESILCKALCPRLHALRFKCYMNL